MTYLNVQSEYLMELSEEQQEVVSGGISIAELLNQNFKSNEEAALVDVKMTTGKDGVNFSKKIAVTNDERDVTGREITAIDSDKLNLRNLLGGIF